MIRSKNLLAFFLACLFAAQLSGQSISAPEPQRGSISAIVTDQDGAAIPGATIVAIGTPPQQRAQTATAEGSGVFVLSNLLPAVPHHLVISAKGFADFNCVATVLTPGQHLELAVIRLQVAATETTDSAASSEQLAAEQVNAAEKQRIHCIIPNFYVVYDKQFVPLTPKLKFKLAFRTSTDAVIFASTAFISGINQAADTPPPTSRAGRVTGSASERSMRAALLTS